MSSVCLHGGGGPFVNFANQSQCPRLRTLRTITARIPWVRPFVVPRLRGLYPLAARKAARGEAAVKAELQTKPADSLIARSVLSLRRLCLVRMSRTILAEQTQRIAAPLIRRRRRGQLSGVSAKQSHSMPLLPYPYVRRRPSQARPSQARPS